MRLALIGDGDSPHLLKWARALAPRVDLFAVSSRGFMPGFDDCLSADRRLALKTTPAFEGGNVGLLLHLGQVIGWLRRVQPDWLHAHYLSSHGTLAALARTLGRLRSRIVGSAWGSDILVAPRRSAAMRFVTSRVLHACELTTSDSQHMAERMRALGAREVMVFPFGLECLPPLPGTKRPHLFFANRGLEPIYSPQRVIAAFATVAQHWPAAELVVANDGSLRAALEAEVQRAAWGRRVRFLGRLDPQAQAHWYRDASWYFSLPQSDSVSVSVLEAMANGCIPVLSDLPANRELVRDGDNGLVLADDELVWADRLDTLAARADEIARANHAWAAEHAMFGPAVERFVGRLRQLQATR